MAERPDPVVEAVRHDLHSRSQRGLSKYGVGLDRTDLGLADWLQHLYEELLDASLYVKRAIMTLRSELPGDGNQDISSCRNRKPNQARGRTVEVPTWFLVVLSWQFVVHTIQVLENSTLVAAFWRGLTGG